MEYTLKPIGVIKTPFKQKEGMPIQGSMFPDAKGIIELKGKYADGLLHLDGFSHIILLYAFHKSEGFDLQTKTFLDEGKHGVFATRAPRRPNPIGLTIVKLDKVVGNRLYVSGVDILDGTPLLDIKPYVPDFDSIPKKVKIGWLKDKGGNSKLSDKTFS
jgi:tRNA-Thr(GGU) m(6)t(6)A37 methyltransferase TsaA